MARHWTYEQITGAAATRLVDYADFLHTMLQERPGEDNSRVMRDVVGNWAMGAVHLWDDLTHGHQLEGDHAHLKALAEGIPSIEPDGSGRSLYMWP